MRKLFIGVTVGNRIAGYTEFFTACKKEKIYRSGQYGPGNKTWRQFLSLCQWHLVKE